ncbi:hypothetical protein ACN28S_28415 [Cystobacter fuscus]
MKEIIDVIRSVYGSFENPDFHFVSEALRQRPYKQIASHLERMFKTEEDTDANDDVSFGYILRGHGQQEWVLRLSMVGPYAVVLRLSGNGSAEVVSPGAPTLEEQALKLLQVLSAQGIQVLSQDELMRPVTLSLYNTDPGNVRIYQALFSDTDVLPWEGEWKDGGQD